MKIYEKLKFNRMRFIVALILCVITDLGIFAITHFLRFRDLYHYTSKILQPISQTKIFEILGIEAFFVLMFVFLYALMAEILKNLRGGLFYGLYIGIMIYVPAIFILKEIIAGFPAMIWYLWGLALVLRCLILGAICGVVFAPFNEDE